MRWVQAREAAEEARRLEREAVRLEEARLVNNRPAYRHVERPTQYIAYNGTSAWNAQSEPSLGQSRGWMQLQHVLK